MADAFTLSIKVQAAQRFVIKRGWEGALIIRGALDEIERQIAAGTPLAAIKEGIIQARGGMPMGSKHTAWKWFDGWTFDLCDYLSTDEELLTIRELSARFHAELEAAK